MNNRKEYEEMCNRISANIRRLRKERGLTQSQLAERLYVSEQAVSKWETRRGIPDIQSLVDLARFFSVTVDELLS